jgi:hypothetical protein
MAGYRVNLTFTEVVLRRTNGNKKEEIQDTKKLQWGFSRRM